jgi:hypothetical protein
MSSLITNVLSVSTTIVGMIAISALVLSIIVYVHVKHAKMQTLVYHGYHPSEQNRLVKAYSKKDITPAPTTTSLRLNSKTTTTKYPYTFLPGGEKVKIATFPMSNNTTSYELNIKFSIQLEDNMEHKNFYYSTPNFAGYPQNLQYIDDGPQYSYTLFLNDQKFNITSLLGKVDNTVTLPPNSSPNSTMTIYIQLNNFAGHDKDTFHWKTIKQSKAIKFNTSFNSKCEHASICAFIKCE